MEASTASLIALPTEVETLVLYYNETLFEDNGWTAAHHDRRDDRPRQRWPTPGIIPFAHANAEWRATNEWFVGEILNHGAGPDKVYQALTGGCSGPTRPSSMR